MNEKFDNKESIEMDDEFVTELFNEVIFFLEKLTEDDTQEMRRAFCRSVFQFVDGVSTDLKNIVSYYESPELIGEDSYLALHDKKKVIKDGKEKTINKRNGFAKNIDFSFDIYGWTADVDINLKQNQKDWDRFLRCVSIRNRVVHPKRIEDLYISNGELVEMFKMFEWLDEALSDAHFKVGTSFLKQANAIKRAFIAQHTD
jgi:hypothetical protein